MSISAQDDSIGSLMRNVDELLTCHYCCCTGTVSLMPCAHRLCDDCLQSDHPVKRCTVCMACFPLSTPIFKSTNIKDISVAFLELKSCIASLDESKDNCFSAVPTPSTLLPMSTSASNFLKTPLVDTQTNTTKGIACISDITWETTRNGTNSTSLGEIGSVKPNSTSVNSTMSSSLNTTEHVESDSIVLVTSKKSDNSDDWEMEDSNDIIATMRKYRQKNSLKKGGFSIFEPPLGQLSGEPSDKPSSESSGKASDQLSGESSKQLSSEPLGQTVESGVVENAKVVTFVATAPNIDTSLHCPNTLLAFPTSTPLEQGIDASGKKKRCSTSPFIESMCFSDEESGSERSGDDDGCDDDILNIDATESRVQRSDVDGTKDHLTKDSQPVANVDVVDNATCIRSVGTESSDIAISPAPWRTSSVASTLSIATTMCSSVVPSLDLLSPRLLNQQALITSAGRSTVDVYGGVKSKVNSVEHDAIVVEGRPTHTHAVVEAVPVEDSVAACSPSLSIPYEQHCMPLVGTNPVNASVRGSAASTVSHSHQESGRKGNISATSPSIKMLDAAASSFFLADEPSTSGFHATYRSNFSNRRKTAPKSQRNQIFYHNLNMVTDDKPRESVSDQLKGHERHMPTDSVAIGGAINSDGEQKKPCLHSVVATTEVLVVDAPPSIEDAKVCSEDKRLNMSGPAGLSTVQPPTPDIGISSTNMSTQCTAPFIAPITLPSWSKILSRPSSPSEHSESFPANPSPSYAVDPSPSYAVDPSLSIVDPSSSFVVDPSQSLPIPDTGPHIQTLEYASWGQEMHKEMKEWRTALEQGSVPSSMATSQHTTTSQHTDHEAEPAAVASPPDSSSLDLATLSQNVSQLPTEMPSSGVGLKRSLGEASLYDTDGNDRPFCDMPQGIPPLGDDVSVHLTFTQLSLESKKLMFQCAERGWFTVSDSLALFPASQQPQSTLHGDIPTEQSSCRQYVLLVDSLIVRHHNQVMRRCVQKQTITYLKALCSGKYLIVDSEWLVQSVKRGKRLPWNDFMIDGAVSDVFSGAVDKSLKAPRDRDTGSSYLLRDYAVFFPEHASALYSTSLSTISNMGDPMVFTYHVQPYDMQWMIRMCGGEIRVFGDKDRRDKEKVANVNAVDSSECPFFDEESEPYFMRGKRCIELGIVPNSQPSGERDLVPMYPRECQPLNVTVEEDIEIVPMSWLLEVISNQQVLPIKRVN